MFAFRKLCFIIIQYTNYETLVGFVNNITTFISTACDIGSFGDDCSESCGHCYDINQCSSINGTCLTGCAAGHQGDLCKTR